VVAVGDVLAHLQELRAKNDLDVVVMMGAGVDIERLLPTVYDAFK
jgi:hypothetical protein